MNNPVFHRTTVVPEDKMMVGHLRNRFELAGAMFMNISHEVIHSLTYDGVPLGREAKERVVSACPACISFSLGQNIPDYIFQGRAGGFNPCSAHKAWFSQ